jgi:kynurenine formamidase
LLRNGIIMFEYLRNMVAIEGERTFFVGLPLKLPDSDGAPARAIAIDGLKVGIAE